MRRVIPVVLACTLLTACGGSAVPPEMSSGSAQQESESETIVEETAKPKKKKETEPIDENADWQLGRMTEAAKRYSLDLMHGTFAHYDALGVIWLTDDWTTEFDYVTEDYAINGYLDAKDAVSYHEWCDGDIPYETENELAQAFGFKDVDAAWRVSDSKEYFDFTTPRFESYIPYIPEDVANVVESGSWLDVVQGNGQAQLSGDWTYIKLVVAGIKYDGENYYIVMNSVDNYDIKDNIYFWNNEDMRYPFYMVTADWDMLLDMCPKHGYILGKDMPILQDNAVAIISEEYLLRVTDEDKHELHDIAEYFSETWMSVKDLAKTTDQIDELRDREWAIMDCFNLNLRPDGIYRRNTELDLPPSYSGYEGYDK